MPTSLQAPATIHPPGPERSPKSPFGLLGLEVVRRIWLIIGGGLLVGILAVFLSFGVTREYTAKATFIPDAGQGMNGALTGLVGQLAGIQNGGMSPRLAGDLARGDALLGRALYLRFPTTRDSARLIDVVAAPSLLARLSGSTSDSSRRHTAALKELRASVDADVNERTGVVDLIVTLPDPVLAAAVTNRLLDLVDDFNARTSQTRARALRQFLEGRADAARRELSVQEDRLQQFYRENRRFNQSPEQLVNETRLRSELELKRGLVVTISQQLEQARIDEVRDTPVITRVLAASPPPKPASPKKSIYGLLGAIIGAAAAILWTLGRSFADWYAVHDPAAYERYLDALAHARRPSLRPVKWKRRGPS